MLHIISFFSARNDAPAYSDDASVGELRSREWRGGNLNPHVRQLQIRQQQPSLRIDLPNKSSPSPLEATERDTTTTKEVHDADLKLSSTPPAAQRTVQLDAADLTCSMPPTKLTIHPPSSIAPTQQEAPATTAGAAAPGTTGYVSPVAPPFSPITPKEVPALPATYPLPVESGSTHPKTGWNANVAPQPQQQQQQQQQQHVTPPMTQPPSANYIPQPPPQPFSSEDSADAIALRAAISSLQFQRKKAQEDIQALQGIRKKALDDPHLFKSELAAGRLKEQKPTIGDLRAILDQEDSEDDDDEEEEKGEEKTDQAPFERIPGPQNVVRMPYINWDKYHIHGEVLDRMHEQQRRWPGGSFDYSAQDRGREFSFAAPYSPWHDSVDGQQLHSRKDSLATPMNTVSEHPMETRRGGGKPHH